MLKVIGTALLTAFVTSMFWIWFYNFVPASPATVARSGNIVAVKPDKAAPVEIAQQVVVGPAGLALPVVGIKTTDLVDTYDAARGAGRRHDAIDIMADEGTPVIAAADGTIEKLFDSVRGGITIYERSADQNWVYYYAHLRPTRPASPKGSRSSAAKSSAASATPVTPALPDPTSISPSTAWRRANDGGTARRSIPIRCLPGNRSTAREPALFQTLSQET